MEPTQLPAHGSIQRRPDTKGRREWAKQAQRFAHEFFNVCFPCGYARNNDGSIQGGYTASAPGNPSGKLEGGKEQVRRINKKRLQMPGKGI